MQVAGNLEAWNEAIVPDGVIGFLDIQRGEYSGVTLWRVILDSTDNSDKLVIELKPGRKPACVAYISVRVYVWMKSGD